MIKKLLIIGFICIALALVFFHQTFFSFASGMALKVYSARHFGESLRYDQIVAKGDTLTIFRPHFSQSKAFQAEEISIQFNIDWRQRQLNVTINCDKPQLKFDRIKVDNQSLKYFLNPKKSRLFKVNSIWNVREAILQFNAKDQVEKTICLDIAFDSLQGGFLRTYFEGNRELHSNELSVHVISKVNEMVVQIECNTLQCCSLLEMCSLYYPFPQLENFKISSGVVDGQLNAYFPLERRPYLEGKLWLSHFAFSDRQLEIEGGVKKALLQLDPNSDGETAEDDNISNRGKLEIIEPAHLASYSKEKGYWHLENILGSMELNKTKTALINFSAQGHSHLSHPQFKLIGEANLNARRFFNVNLNLSCLSEGEEKGFIQFLVQQPTDTSKVAEIKCQRLSYTFGGFLQNCLSPYWTAAKDIEFQGGTLDAIFDAELTRKGFTNIRCLAFQAEHLKFKILPLSVVFYFPYWSGEGSIDLNRRDVLDSLNAKIHIRNGEFSKEGNRSLVLSDIHTHLIVNRGDIERSLVKLKFAGLKGILGIEWGKGKKLLSANLEGHFQDVLEFLPISMQQVLQESFKDNQIGVSANLKEEAEQLLLEGTVLIPRVAESKQMDIIHFGCDLYRKEGATHSPGWFYAKDLPLKKYVSPFIFKKGIAQLDGIGEFIGAIDAEKITVKYLARDLKIENEDLLIEIKDSPATLSGEFPGAHTFNLKNFSHEGLFPIQNAYYLEKNTGFNFNDIYTQVHFKDETICLQSLEAICEGIEMKGQIDLNYSDPAPGVFTIALNLPSINGKISQMRCFLSQLKDPPFLAKIPLEGDIETRNQGLNLKFDFNPKNYSLGANFQGSISNGTLPIENMHMSIQDLGMNIEYRHDKETLDLSDIQGALLVGKPQEMQEYQIIGDHLRFQDLENQNADVNIEIKHKEHSLMRIVACTETLDASSLKVCLDQKASHFCGIQPSDFQLTIANWSSIKNLSVQAPFSLETIWPHIQALMPTGLFLPKKYLHQLDQVNHVKGQFQIGLNYRESNPCLLYEVEGQQIEVNGMKWDTCLLKGKKQESNWNIEQLKLDQLSLSADIERQSDEWKLGFLALNYGRSFIVGFNGVFSEKNSCLDATVNFLETNLAYLNEWAPLRSFMSQWQPEGALSGKGKLKLEFLDGAPWYRLETNIQANIPQIIIGGCPIAIKKPISLHYLSHRKFEILGMESALSHQSEEQCCLTIDRIQYNIEESQLKCPQAHFSIPAIHLENVSMKLHRHFPQLIDERLSEVMQKIKTEGDFSGMLNFEKNPQNYTWNAFFDDGLYHFKNHNYPLKNFQMEGSPYELKFFGLSYYENCTFHIRGNADLPHFDHGQIILANQTVSSEPPLFIDWKDDAINGWVIQSMHGSFSGLKIELENGGNPAPPHWSMMQGQVEIDFNALYPLLDPPLIEKIQALQLGASFALKGLYCMNPKMGQDFLDTFYFEGELHSQSPILKGYLLEKLYAELSYSPKHLKLKNFNLADPAGLVTCPDIHVFQNEQNKEWMLTIPQINILDFKPSLLQDTLDPSPSKFKTLVVPTIEVKDFYGTLNDKTSWQTSGYLHFLNPSRKNYHPLLAIPAEILLRLGLDPHVLNPVSGTIYFIMQGDRFYLTKFKDVYGEGRGSKFYLANQATPSWMDINGNLNVQIRMKQYNLIFKIAELFTVSVQGNLKKPKYSLQRNEKTKTLKNAKISQ